MSTSNFCLAAFSCCADGIICTTTRILETRTPLPLHKEIVARTKQDKSSWSDQRNPLRLGERRREPFAATVSRAPCLYYPVIFV